MKRIISEIAKNLLLCTAVIATTVATVAGVFLFMGLPATGFFSFGGIALTPLLTVSASIAVGGFVGATVISAMQDQTTKTKQSDSSESFQNNVVAYQEAPEAEITRNTDIAVETDKRTSWAAKTDKTQNYDVGDAPKNKSKAEIVLGGKPFNIAENTR